MLMSAPSEMERMLHESSGEDADVERGAGFEGSLCLEKEGAFEVVRGRSGVDVSGKLPDHVGGLGNAASGAVVH